MIDITKIPLPMALDASKSGEGASSATLWFTYVAHTVVTGSTIYLCYRDAIAGSIQATLVWALSMVFYRMRQVDKFKVDFTNKSLEMEDTPDESKA